MLKSLPKAEFVKVTSRRTKMAVKHFFGYVCEIVKVAVIQWAASKTVLVADFSKQELCLLLKFHDVKKTWNFILLESNKFFESLFEILITTKVARLANKLIFQGYAVLPF